jgi:cytochrome P450
VSDPGLTGVGQATAVTEMTRLTAFAEVEEVFRSRSFVQAGGGRRDSKPVYGDTLLSLSGPDHSERRRIEASLFRRPTLAHYEQAVLAPALAEALADRARPRDADGRVRVELLGLVRTLLVQVSAALVGLDGAGEPAALGRLVEAVGRLGDGANVEWSTRDHREVIREALEGKQSFVDGFFLPAWRRRAELVAAWRAGRVAEADLPADLLTMLALHPDHFARWGPEVYANEAILFTVANVGSPTNALAHVVDELARWLAAHPGDRARLETAGFLRNAVNETLRLHPATPYVLRQAAGDVRLASGRTIRAGEPVTLEIARANRDPAAFGPDADRFDPHRAGAGAAAGAALSFGAGAHTCIGKLLAVSDGPSEEPGTHGTMVRILRELYRAGLRPDPSGAPRLREDNVRQEYATFPVVLDRL